MAQEIRASFSHESSITGGRTSIAGPRSSQVTVSEKFNELIPSQSSAVIIGDKSYCEPEDTDKLTDCVGEKVCIREKNLFRKTWSLLLALALLYVATLLPYKLAFHEFRVPDAVEDVTWNWLSLAVDIFFWVDLVLNFLMTYRDSHGRECTRLSRIARRYIRGAFFIDLVSCLPTQVFEQILILISSQAAESSPHKAGRIARLNRLPKLAKITRIARLGKIFGFLKRSGLFRKMYDTRGFREVGFLFGFITIAHLMACGWYMVASLSGKSNWPKTWIWRREASGSPILGERPSVQWLHSLYFVVTVFTSVGFGDMSGFTQPEMMYCVITMIVGCLVNSMIMGQVINIMQASDQLSTLRENQATLIKNFAEHTQLPDNIITKFLRFINHTQSVHRGYDRTQIKKLMTLSVFPRELEGQIPNALFRGELMRNDMLKVVSYKDMPVRMPLYVALAVHERFMVKSDMIYCTGDHATCIHLVLNGVFAYVAVSRKGGGEAQSKLNSMDSLITSGMRYKAAQKLCSTGEYYPYQLFCRRSYFGDIEILRDMHRRKSSVRCESDGSMLVFDRHDLRELEQEFPTQMKILTKVALSREVTRVRILSKLKVQYTSFVDHAASKVQAAWRTRRSSKPELSEIMGDPTTPKYKVTKNPLRPRGESGSTVDIDSMQNPAVASERTSKGSPVVDASVLRKNVDVVVQDMAQLQSQVAALTGVVSEVVQEIAAVSGRKTKTSL